MKHIGIIAEYNPFHNGHLYQINEIKKQFPNKKIIVIMSGNFVQRGEPAIFNKYIRTKCALAAGIDCVFELPSAFATASAEHFATAGVIALYKTGVIDTICFGAENDNADLFYKIAQILIDEPSEFQSLLKKYLKNGDSFPKARKNALCQYLNDFTIEHFLQSPNNILGIEYVKAILKYNLPLKIYIVKRTVSDYHSTSIQQDISSATALRDHIKKTGSTTNLEHTLPPVCLELLSKDTHCNPVFSDHFYSLIQYSLWDKKDNYDIFLDVNQELANKLLALKHYPDTYEELIQLLSGKNYTQSRIRHALLNILLSITKDEMLLYKENNYVTYLRLLGFRKQSTTLLKEMKDVSSLNIINKVANANLSDNRVSEQSFHHDLEIAHLYNQVYDFLYHTVTPSEYEHSVIIEN